METAAGLAIVALMAAAVALLAYVLLWFSAGPTRRRAVPGQSDSTSVKPLHDRR
jgi:hypothetical protein